MSDEILSLSGADPRAVHPSFEFGRVLRTTFSIYFANMVPILALSLFAYFPVVIAGWLMRDGVYLHPSPTSFVPFLLVTTICTQFEVAFVTVAVFRILRGTPMRLGDCIATGIRKAPVALLTAIVVGCLTVLGVLLCLVPGIIVAMMFAVAIPVAIVENKWTFDAMWRSRELTKGNRWSIFAVYLLTGVVLNAPLQVVALFLRTHPMAYVIWALGTGWLTGTFTAVLACVVYYQLRESHESIDLADLAAVFD